MLTDAPWPQAVLVKKEVHFCRNLDDVKATFSDWKSINALGGYSQLSIPLKDGEKVIGAINFAGGEGVYDDETVRKAQSLAPESSTAMQDWIQHESQ
jgi:hypothetical protein